MIVMWNKLLQYLGNEYAVAGIMGNLEAESGLKSSNVQNSYENKLGMNDVQYTQAVNNKTYSRNQFYNDRAGYGFAQWTHWSRKQKLYDFIFNNGYNDISSVDGQIDFIYKELKETYTGLLKQLVNAKSVKEASDAFCKCYENPANQSEANLQKRADKGMKWYEKYHSTGQIIVNYQNEMQQIYECLKRMGFKQ